MQLRFKCPACSAWHYPLASSSERAQLVLLLVLGVAPEPFSVSEWRLILGALRKLA